MSFNHLEIEKKWQKYWVENKTFKSNLESEKPKYYVLDMFPYPSGSGLHVGHPEGYTATDVMARMRRMQGYNVMHPMGWDAFGLPAEQYAIQTGQNPQGFTEKNIQIFKQQLQMLGFSYDWDREIATSDPKYYKWTQWIFLKLYDLGLAEIRDIEVNWCDELRTVLANEEVLNVGGKMVSERGHYPVTKRPMKQWVLKITEYAEHLLNDLDDLDWPEYLKDMQRNWIGKSEGAKIKFAVANSEESFEVFTTRADTLYGATYCVLAPEHELVLKITPAEKLQDVKDYINYAKAKSDLDRTDLNKDKTGIFTGAHAINPLTNKEIPIWIADYVLSSYGTGAIMAVPAHDERDNAFATKFGLDIIQVVDGDMSEGVFIGDGPHINSELINGLYFKEANNLVIEHLAAKGVAKHHINYKLRDWIFSRQRYWGEPFPIIIYEDGTIETLDVNDLPLELPKLDKIIPSESGESPLANAGEWLYVERKDGLKGKRETNTMPQWAGSCWYYIGFLLKDGDDYLSLSDKEVQDKINKWLPVDLYIGGTEHAVLHLLYSRFWHKVLYDCGIVKSKEPFQKLFNQGMILGEDGEKMSKSRGNVVNPDDIVEEFGADTLRLYEMFMGPLEATKPWSTKSVEGPRRFLERVYRLYKEVATIVPENKNLETIYHQTVKKVTNDYENLRFNTAISQLMIFINECYKDTNVPFDYLIGFLKLLNPIAPHITEELYEKVFNKTTSIAYEKWPTYDEEKTKENNYTLIIQVNGKLRDRIDVALNSSKEELEKLALSSEKVQSHLSGKEIVRIIVVINKLVNIVIK